MHLHCLSIDELRNPAVQAPSYWQAQGIACPDQALPPGFVFEFCQAQIAAHPSDAWWYSPRLMLEDSPRRVVGSALFKSYSGTEGSAELGYGVAPSEQHRGYATLAVKLLVAQAFAHSSLKAVFALVSPSNAASIRVLARNGFCLVGQAQDPDDGLVLRYELGRPLAKEPR